MNSVILRKILIGFLIVNILLTLLVIVDSIFMFKIILYHYPYIQNYGKLGISFMILSVVLLIVGFFKINESKLFIVLPTICLTLEFISMFIYVVSIFI